MSYRQTGVLHEIQFFDGRNFDGIDDDIDEDDDDDEHRSSSSSSSSSNAHLSGRQSPTCTCINDIAAIPEALY